MQPMNVLVIDGQGGGLGKQLVAALSTQCPEARLTAVGTNSLAANAMRKAGAPRAATGENAVVVNCRRADVIVGPIGIVIADSRAPRDGKFTEKIGVYNPNTNPATVDLNFDRALYWLEVGAQPTDTVREILKKAAVL